MDYMIDQGTYWGDRIIGDVRVCMFKKSKGWTLCVRERGIFFERESFRLKKDALVAANTLCTERYAALNA